MNAEVKNWLVAHFAESQKLEDASCTTDIFDAGWVDSLGIIMLVEEMESKFGFKFAQEQLTDRRFRTINGIAELVDEILK